MHYLHRAESRSRRMATTYTNLKRNKQRRVQSLFSPVHFFSEEILAACTHTYVALAERANHASLDYICLRATRLKLSTRKILYYTHACSIDSIDSSFASPSFRRRGLHVRTSVRLCVCVRSSGTWWPVANLIACSWRAYPSEIRAKTTGVSCRANSLGPARQGVSHVVADCAVC